MADLDACTLLRQADLAYSQIRFGGAVRSVQDQNGERIEFSSANAASLLAYMRVLQAQCDTYTAVALGTDVTKPMKYFF